MDSFIALPCQDYAFNKFQYSHKKYLLFVVKYTHVGPDDEGW